MPPSDPRFFTEAWSIELASAPHLKFHRMEPTNHTLLATWTKLLTNNSPGAGTPAGDEAALAAQAAQATLTLSKRFNQAFTAHQALEVLVEVDGQAAGRGAVVQIQEDPPLANIGISLAPEARGRGVGKALMRVLLRLSNEVDVGIIQAGTMKENTAMRALARSLGLEETEEVKIAPGRGVVAEVLFKNIPRENWMGLEMDVSFLGRLEPVLIEEEVEIKDGKKTEEETKDS
ncbi:hypothetical protein BP6252_12051 [Coleophoma cylindrospora]|uniref:N-acetyltransferase domain-containing protein n=1 Tax=Coleophoma cylindrospora TaxID=1849047 RepID=A0A3D8QG53_9HELO|nr:hypothetical protein BP6252_12051 [Coleophoma cylindrospora]